MADKTMHHVVIGSDTYEIVDSVARVGAEAAFATDTASGAVATFSDGADNVPVKSLTVQIQPQQAGSGDPAPDNVRAISGWDAVKVTVAGADLSEGISLHNGALSGYNGGATSSTTRIYCDFIAVTPGKTYSIKTVPDCANVVRFYDADKAYVGKNDDDGSTWHENGRSITVSDSTHFIRIMFSLDMGAQTAIAPSYVTQYVVAETGHEYTIDLPQTVYGGKLDVTKGELVIDSQYMPFPTIRGTALYNGVRRFYSRSDVCYGILACDSLIVSDEYEYKKVGYISAPQDDHSVVVTPSWAQEVTTVAEFNELLASHPINLVSKLATPITYTLTPTGIRTLLGENNVWNDCGDTDVEYRADTKLYIEKLTAPTEDDMIADHAISANSFFMVGNTLYRATTAIASGATITVGTNATKLSLSDALNALA